MLFFPLKYLQFCTVLLVPRKLSAVLSRCPICGILVLEPLSSTLSCSFPPLGSVLYPPRPPPNLPGAVCYGPLSSKHGAQGATAASTPMAAAGDLTRCQLSTKTQVEALGLLKGLWAFINTDDKIFPSVGENRFLSLTLEVSFSYFFLKN